MSCFAAADTNGLVIGRVPYHLVFKRYWRSLIGTAGTWYGQLSSTIAPFSDLLRFIYDFVAFPNVVFSGTIISSVTHNGDEVAQGIWSAGWHTTSKSGVPDCT